MDDVTRNMKEIYDYDVNECINMKLMSKYGVKGYSNNVYCKKYEEPTDMPKNSNDYLFLTVITINMAIIIIVSIYDKYRIKGRPLSKRIFIRFRIIINQIFHLDSLETYFFCFSFQRNWKKLISINTSKQALDLRFIQTSRLAFTYFIISGHIVRNLCREPTKNPEYFENKYHTIQGMIQMNGVYVVQLFFFISGFMWALAFNELASRAKQLNIGLGFFAIVLRYLR